MNKHGIKAYTYQDSDFKVHYHKGGKGPVLLFIHGFALDAMMNWVDQMILFSNHYTVIAPDLLWFGQSSSSKNPDLSSQREAIERLLKDLNIDKVHVIGQSYGGFVAIDLALKNPGLVDKLCIANSPGTTFDEKSLEPLLRDLQIDKISELFVMKSPLDIRRLLHVASYKKPYFPEFILQQLHQQFFTKHHAKWANLLDTLPDEKNRIESLDELKHCQVMMLWGDEDRLFVKSEGEKFARLISCKFVSIPKAGHASQLDEPSAFNKAMKEFFLD
jgi:pimeloyl-ACP methyl ester carboxylesterase